MECKAIFGGLGRPRSTENINSGGIERNNIKGAFLSKTHDALRARTFFVLTSLSILRFATNPTLVKKGLCMVPCNIYPIR